MTVAEMIAELQKMPPDLHVMVETYDGARGLADVVIDSRYGGNEFLNVVIR